MNTSEKIEAQSVPQSRALTGHGPAATAFYGKLYCAWKIQEGYGIHYAFSGDGQYWETYSIYGVGTSGRPDLTAFKGNLYLVWRGQASDTGLWYTFSGDGLNWKPQIRFPAGANSDHGPGLAAFNDNLYLFWTGNDGSIRYISSNDGLHWGEQADYAKIS